MAGKSFIRLVSGVMQQVLGVQTSAGAGNAGDIPALDANGRLDNSMMPVGIGADTVSATASETLSAGDWVNLYNNTGSLGVRKADATTVGKEVDGFVLAGVASSGTAVVYKEGTNTQCSSLTPGSDLFMTTTPGIASATAPSGSGNVVQRIGKALSATSADFERGIPVTLN